MDGYYNPARATREMPEQQYPGMQIGRTNGPREEKRPFSEGGLGAVPTPDAISPPPMGAAMRSLMARISEAEHAAEQLEKRLQPVLVPQHTDLAKAARQGMDRPACSEVTATLQEQTGRLEALINRMNEMRERLEI